MFSRLNGAAFGTNFKVFQGGVEEKMHLDITDFTISTLSNCDFFFLHFVTQIQL